MSRTYRKNRRAEGEAATRRRIVEAAIALHQAQGVAATSMRDVAARAGVGTATVYRHFPDEAALTGACSGSYMERHPLPDPAPLAAIGDPEERLRQGLRMAYAYHRETAAMYRSVLPDMIGKPLGAPYEAYWRDYATMLLAAWPADEEAPLRAASVPLALRFATWDLLAGAGLTDEEATDLMLRLVRRC